MHPYKVSVVPKLYPNDHHLRLNYCQWFNANLNNDEILDKTFFTDEAWVHLSGYVNNQNYRTWATDNPHVFIESELHPQKLGIWVAISRRRIIGPIFFEGTINADRYRNEILDPFINQLHEDELMEGYFQQDNATPHTANRTINFLQEFFDDRLISRGLWPPRSPQLTPPDAFLFGYLKDSIFQNRPHNLVELRAAIEQKIAEITPEMLIRVFENLKRRVNVCLEAGGGHFDHLL